MPSWSDSALPFEDSAPPVAGDEPRSVQTHWNVARLVAHLVRWSVTPLPRSRTAASAAAHEQQWSTGMGHARYGMARARYYRPTLLLALLLRAAKRSRGMDRFIRQAEVLECQAELAWIRGDRTTATTLVVRRVSLLRAALGPGHPDVAWARYELARIYTRTARLTGALLHLKQAVPVIERLGPGGEPKAFAVHRLAGVCARRVAAATPEGPKRVAHVESAIAHLARAIEIAHRLGLDDDVDDPEGNTWGAWFLGSSHEATLPPIVTLHLLHAAALREVGRRADAASAEHEAALAQSRLGR
jgi:hypothetical protein